MEFNLKPKPLVNVLALSPCYLTYFEVSGHVFMFMFQIERVSAERLLHNVSVSHPHTAAIKVSQQPLVGVELYRIDCL